MNEGSARIKLRFIIAEKAASGLGESDEAKMQKSLIAAASSTESHADEIQNTTLQPCVNFPYVSAEEKAKKYDFTPILNREELE